MQQFTYFSLLLLFLSSSLTGAEFDLSLYDQYRIDTVKYSYPQFKLNYQSDQDNLYLKNHRLGSGDLITYSRDYDQSVLNLNGAYYNYFESESRVRSVSLTATIQNNSSGVKTKSSYKENSQYNTRNLAFTLSYSDQFYLKTNPGWYLGVSGRLSNHRNSSEYTDKQIGSTSTYSYYNNQINQDGTQNHFLDLQVGRGRVRDVTNIHRALLVLNRLEELGVATEALSSGDVVRLAQALDTKDEYTRLHYRSAKYYWQHLESVLDTLGIPTDNLTLYSTLYLTEAVNLLHHARYSGAKWSVGSSMDYSKNYNERKTYDKADSLLTNNRSWKEDNFLMLVLSYSWMRPVSMNATLGFNSDLSVGPSMNASSSTNQKYSLSLGAGGQYDITDRVMASINGQYSMSRVNSRNLDYDELFHDFITTISLKYYLIDQAYIDLSYTCDYTVTKYIDRELPPDTNYFNGEVLISFIYSPRSPSY